MRQKDSYLIWALVGLKIIIHFLTNTNYGLHRDEFLYLDEGLHLQWGFMEVPPLTPFLAWLVHLMGSSIFMVRLFPALAGALIIYLACRLVVSLGGSKWAILFCGLSLVFSPQLLGTNTLFQPVSFNQLFWFLAAYALIKIIQTEQKHYWYLLGLFAGLGFLNKYSIIFYFVGLILAVILSPQRKYLKTRYPYLALTIASLIALPNLIWQYQHNWPVLAHMEALSSSQLVHLNWLIYLGDQMQTHFLFTLVWIAGVIGLFRLKAFFPFRPLAIALLITVLLIGLLSGKSYYTAGAYLILFPFGGIYLNQLLQSQGKRVAVLLGMLFLTLPVLPYAVPLLRVKSMASYCSWVADNLGLKAPLRWEDGQYYALPQDIADMHGWEELAQKVAIIYHALPAEKQATCSIYGGSYGHAGAINYFAKKYNLPETHSLSSSYMMWAPSTINFDNQIMIDDVWQDSSSWFTKMNLVDSLSHPYAREVGYIYYRQSPKIDVQKAWQEFVLERKTAFNFD